MPVFTNYLILQIVLICSRVRAMEDELPGAYSLAPHPAKTCTIHVKTMENDTKSSELFGIIVNQNQIGSRFLWTLSRTEEDVYGPLYNFHEFCTISILIDSPLGDLKKILVHLEKSNHTWRAEGNTFTIIVQYQFVFNSIYFQIPTGIFVRTVYDFRHIETFPQLYFCGRCINVFSTFKVMYDVNQLEMARRFWDSSKRIALEVPQSTKVGATGQRICTNGSRIRSSMMLQLCEPKFLFHELAGARFNLTITHIHGHGEQMRTDTVMVPSFGYSILNVDAKYIDLNSLYSVGSGNFRLLYCDYSNRWETMTLLVWAEPFDYQIWSLIALLIVGLSITLIFQFANKKELQLNRVPPELPKLKHKSRDAAFAFFIGTASLVRQLPRSDCGLLLFSAFFTNVITSLYENIITSQLIIPPEDTVFQNTRELVEAGYTIEIPNLYNLSLDDLGRETIGSEFAKHAILDKLNSSIVIAQNFSYAIFGNASARHACLDLSEEEAFGAFIVSKMQIVLAKYKCHRVEEKIGTQIYYWGFWGGFRSYVRETFAIFITSGIKDCWDALRKHAYSLELRKVKIRNNYSNKNDDLITFSQLGSFFALSASSVTVATMVFFLEKIRWFKDWTFAALVYYVRESLEFILSEIFRFWARSQCKR